MVKKNTETKNQPTDLPVMDVTPPPKKVTKVVNYLILAALAFIAVAIGIFLMWSFESEKVLEIKNSPFPTRSVRENATTGGVIILDIDYCKHSDAHGEVRVSFVSKSREVFLPIAYDDQGANCRHTEVPVLIPTDLPPDTYKVKFRTTYEVNPIKKGIVNEFESQEFIVTNGEVITPER